MIHTHPNVGKEISLHFADFFYILPQNAFWQLVSFDIKKINQSDLNYRKSYREIFIDTGFLENKEYTNNVRIKSNEISLKYSN